MTRSLRIAVVVTAVAAVVVAASTLIGVHRASAASKTGYCALLPDAIGLYVGNPVTQMGIRIGEITEIEGRDTDARVSFAVDSDRRIPANVRAVTRSKSVLADRSLELVGNYVKGPTLQTSTCIPLDRSFTPKSISEITGSAADLIEQLAPEGDARSVEGSITAMSDALAGTGPQIAELMTTASRAARNPDRTIADIGTIITTTAPLTGDALQRWDDISSIITKLPTATDVAARVLWPGTVHMIYGMQPVLLAISDFVPKYGEYLYATLDILADAIHIAATRVGDIKQALNMIPMLASSTALVAQRGRGAGLRVRAPQVRLKTANGRAFCARLNKLGSGRCVSDGRDTRLVRVGVLDLLVAGVSR